MILTDGLCGTDSTTWNWLTDGTGRYAGNRSLKYFNASLPNLTTGVEMFKGCTALSAVEKGERGTMAALNNATSMFEGSGIVKGGIVPIQGGNATAMYKNCKNLTLFNANTITNVNCDSMFEGCSNLNKMISSGYLTIASAIKMFKDCTSFYGLSSYSTGGGGEITISGSSESMFEGCTELRSFPSSGLIIKNMTNCKNMFAGCIKLRTVYAYSGSSGMEGTQITTTEGMFKGCIKLIEAPNILSNVATADSMYEGCVSLTSAGNAYSDYGALAAYNLVSANNMFAGCTSMTNVMLNFEIGTYDETCGDNANLVKAKGMFGNDELGWCKLDFANALGIIMTITNLANKVSDGTDEWGKISIGVAAELKDYTEPVTGKSFEELLLNGDADYANDKLTTLKGPNDTDTPIQRVNVARGLLTKGWTVELHYDDGETKTISPTSAG